MENAYNRGVGDGVDCSEARRGNIKEGDLVAMAKQQTLRGRGCGPGLNDVPLGLSSNWNVWAELHSLPQSLGPGHQQELPVPLWNAQDEGGSGKGQQASQVWIFLMLTTEGSPPQRNLENSSKSQRDLMDKLFLSLQTLSLTFFRLWRDTLEVFPCTCSPLLVALLPVFWETAFLLWE